MHCYWLFVIWDDTPRLNGPLAKNCEQRSGILPIVRADLGVGSRFGPLRRQKRSKSKFLVDDGPKMGQNFHFGHSSQGYKWLKFSKKVPLCRVFLSSAHPVGIFFDILVC